MIAMTETDAKMYRRHRKIPAPKESAKEYRREKIRLPTGKNLRTHPRKENRLVIGDAVNSIPLCITTEFFCGIL